MMMMVVMMMSMVMVTVVMVRHRGRAVKLCALSTRPQAFKLRLLFSRETKLLNKVNVNNPQDKAG
jgi:hypothetical protein